MESAFKKADGFIVEHKKQFKKAGRAIAIAGGVIVGTMGLLVKSAVGLNREMANVATLIPGQTARIQELKKNVQTMSMAYGKATTDITGGLYNVISAFGDTADTSKILETNVKAAAAGMADTNDAINLTSAVTKAYGETNAEAITKVADLALLTVRLGQTTFPELANSIGLVTGLSEELNLKETELFTTFATLTGVTGNAAKVSTQFSGILAAMIKPTEGMSLAVKQLGKEKGLGSDATAKAIIQELGFKGTLEGLAAQTDGTTVGLGKLFASKEALVGLLPLLSSQSKVYDEKLKQMENSAGALDEAFREMSDGINKAGFDMARLKQTGIVLAQKLGDKLAPTIGKIALTVGKVVTGVIKWIDKHPVLTGVILKVVGALGALMVILGPILMVLPGIVAAVGAMSAGFLAVAGPVVAVIAVLTVVVAIITTLIGRAKKLRETLAKLGKTDEEIAKSLDEVAEKAGMTAKEFDDLNKKYDGNYKKMIRHIEKGKLGPEMQKALADQLAKTGEVLDEQTESLEENVIVLKDFVVATSKANDEVKAMAATLVDEVKKATLEEYEYAKWAAEQKYNDRKSSIENQVAAEEDGAEAIKVLEASKIEALALLNESYDLELKKLSEEKIKRDEETKEEAIKIEKDKISAFNALQKENWKKLIAAEKAYQSLKQISVDAIKKLTLSDLEYKKWAMNEEYKRRRAHIKKMYGATESGMVLIEGLEEEFYLRKTELAVLFDEEEKARLEALKEARKASLEETMAAVSSILNMIGKLFADSYALKMTLIDNEEKRRLEAINSQYNAELEANQALLDAEKEKSAEILESLDEDYEAKKQYIMDNVADEEERAKLLAALEIKHNADLQKAREERELAEKATADALLEVEEAKNEAIRLASEELEKKRSKARRTAAKQEKAVALLSAIVNTAMAVVKALTAPFPLNIPLAIAVGILGAVQIAIIAATPIPLKEGGIVTRRTEAVIGEAGTEAVIPLNKIGDSEEFAPIFAPEIIIEMEPIIIQRDNEIVIKIVKKGFEHGQLTVPIKAVGG